MATTLRELSRFAPSAASVTAQAGLQVSGYTNPTLALFLWAAAVLALLWPAWHWWRERRRKLEPTDLIFVGIGGTLIFAAIAVAGLIWQQKRPGPLPETIIVPSDMARGRDFTTAREPITIPNPPALPGDLGTKAARYLQLKKLVEELKGTEQRFSSASQTALEASKPDDPKKPGNMPGASGRTRMWALQQRDAAAENIKRIAALAYNGWPLDFESAPAIINPLLKAPEEERFGDNADAAYKYRAAYYRDQNIKKQTATLLEAMEKELSSLEAAIVNTPAAPIGAK